MNEAQQHSGFEFAACEDKGALKGAPDVTAKLISDVNYIYSTFEQSPNYMRKNGRPVIALFGEETLQINWIQVAADVQGNPLFIWRDNGGFTQQQSAGSFSWVGLTSNPADPGLAYLDSFYQTALTTTGKQTFGSGYKGFNDSIAPWGSHRLLDQQCGQTWLATLADINNHYSAGNQLGNIQIPTWNDYEEGTEIETGIDNCVSISASVTGQTLSWSISGQENTLHHYAIYATADGVNLLPLGTVNASTHSPELEHLLIDFRQLHAVRSSRRPAQSPQPYVETGGVLAGVAVKLRQKCASGDTGLGSPPALCQLSYPSAGATSEC